MPMIRSIRRRLSLAGVGVLACAAALSIASCTMVGDTITGVTLDRTESSACLAGCRDDYNDAIAVERKRHQEQGEVCKSLSSVADRNDCLAAEDALHKSILDQLKVELNDCQNGCHRQGGGSAG